MTQTILTVTYGLTEAARQDDASALKQQFSLAAPLIAATPGLSWKISAIDADAGVGLGLYLFETDAAARDFVDGALLERLRRNPGIADLRVTRAPVLRALSLSMGAGQAIGPSPVVGSVMEPAIAVEGNQ